MRTETTTKKTGKRILSLLSVAFLATVAAAGAGSVARADDSQFTAQLDRDTIGLDDTVSLKLSITTDGNAAVSVPSFTAPDFDLVNSYDSSFVESYYDSTTGRFGMKNSQQVTKVLKPVRQGDLRITHIQIRMNGQVKTAPDLVVHVMAPGAGTPPPRAYGGGGVGLRGAGKPSGSRVMLRAEVDKDHVYKGEQIVVSYYLYRRVRMLNVQVDKFPQLPGFLREELEMPVMQPRMDSESVVVDGVAYQRSLLARYAAYPLQEGKLTLDPMGIKYSYYGDPGVTDDGDDPIMNFFKTMAPREASVQSENVTIDVVPLPAVGRPASFSGGVGDFNVVSAVDKTQVRANEAVTVTVKVEGRGNLAAIGLPSIKWPPNVEVYDTKSTSKSGKSGVGEKIFEVLLIPRTPGQITLPGIDFSFFDPATKQYVSRSTDPIPVTVTESAPGGSVATSNPAVGSAAPNSATNAQSDAADIRGLHAPSAAAVTDLIDGVPYWRFVYYLASVAILVFLLIVGKDVVRQVRGKGARLRAERALAKSRSWDRLRKLAAEAQTGLSWSEVAQAYETLESVIFDAIDRAYSLGVRSMARAELKRQLVNGQGLDDAHWNPVDRLLEFSEMVRFGGSASASLETRARSELGQWVSTAQNAIETLQNLKPR